MQWRQARAAARQAVVLLRWFTARPPHYCDVIVRTCVAALHATRPSSGDIPLAGPETSPSTAPLQQCLIAAPAQYCTSNSPVQLHCVAVCVQLSDAYWGYSTPLQTGLRPNMQTPRRSSAVLKVCRVL